MARMFKYVVPVLLVVFFLSSDVKAEEGDFFFGPEFGWSHFYADTLKEGIYAGAHFGYDTSDHLTVELIMFYGDNNGEGGNQDLRYILGGGGIAYKFFWKKFKPSLFTGANVAGLDFSTSGSQIKGGLYVGGALEYYLNKVVSLGFTFKYFPVIGADDITLLGCRVGLEL